MDEQEFLKNLAMIVTIAILLASGTASLLFIANGGVEALLEWMAGA